MDGEVSAEEFARLENFFFSRGAAVNVETSPHADASLFAHYGKNGYRATEFTNVLVRRVDASEGDVAERGVSTGAAVDEVPASEKDLWVRTVCMGFAEHYAGTDELMEVMGLFGSTSGRRYIWRGWMEWLRAGGPCSCAMELRDCLGRAR